MKKSEYSCNSFIKTYFSYSIAYTVCSISLEEVLADKKCPQKHDGSYAISMTANTLFSWYLPLTNHDPTLLRMPFTLLVFTQNYHIFYVWFVQ